MSLGFQETFQEERRLKVREIEGVLVEDSFQLFKLNWDIEIDMGAAFMSRV
jgi:hypothetical protein